jgi:hypothetical protein
MVPRCASSRVQQVWPCTLSTGVLHIFRILSESTASDNLLSERRLLGALQGTTHARPGRAIAQSGGTPNMVSGPRGRECQGIPDNRTLIPGEARGRVPVGNRRKMDTVQKNWVHFPDSRLHGFQTHDLRCVSRLPITEVFAPLAGRLRIRTCSLWKRNAYEIGFCGCLV